MGMKLSSISWTHLKYLAMSDGTPGLRPTNCRVSYLYFGGTAGPFGINTTTFAHNVVLICGKILERFHESVRPTDHDLFRLCSLPQTEVNSQIALRNETIATPNFLFVLIAILFERHLRPQSGAVRFHTDQLEADEVEPRRFGGAGDARTRWR